MARQYRNRRNSFRDPEDRQLMDLEAKDGKATGGYQNTSTTAVHPTSSPAF
jgi:oligoendopeptidase F